MPNNFLDQEWYQFLLSGLASGSRPTSTPKPTVQAGYPSGGYNTGKSALQLEWLRAHPEAVYSQAISGLSRPMQSYFGPRFGTYYNRYMGELANQDRPSGLQFMDWLGGLDLPSEYYQAGRRQRGGYTSTLAPRTRFLYY